MSWIQAVAIEKLESKGSLLFRQEHRQIVMFLIEGEVFALDNRCPHEGYPLQQGTADEGSCILTCQWHNWKFDMKTGECVLGGDHVRTYPTRREGSYIWLNLEEPSAEKQQATILKGLREAMGRQQYGRISRSITKLHAAGLDPVVALEQAIEWTYDRLEYGTTHAYGASADWLQRYDDWEGDIEQQIICITEAIDHIAFDTLRHPSYPFPEEVQDFKGLAFLDAIEAEDEKQAISLIRGALQTHLTWDDLEYWFSKAALAHYNDFGHALIFVLKTGQLLKRLAHLKPEALLFPLVRSLCYSTREDMIPEFHRYASFVKETPDPLATQDSLQTLTKEDKDSLQTLTKEDKDSLQIPTKEDKDSLQTLTKEDRDSLFTASVNQAMTWVSSHTEKYTAPELYLVLLEASARNLLFYNTEYQDAFDKPVGQNIGWLHCTHAVTFANAVRHTATRYPDLWREGLLQMACFVGRNQSYTDRKQDTESWYVESADEWMTAAWERILDHGMLPPIFSAHLLKMWCAVREEIAELSEGNEAERSCKRHILASFHRFLHAPLKQKHVRRTARQSMNLIMG